jgi:hypothetical protein
VISGFSGIADGKSKSDAAKQLLLLLLLLGEEVAVVTTLLFDNVDVGNERSCGIVKPRDEEDHDSNNINAS